MMCCFSYIQLYLILFSHSDHCRRWDNVLKELLEVILQRHLDRYSTMIEKQTKTRSPLRPSSLTDIVRFRSLWSSVMQELTEKFMYKQSDCNKQILEQDEEDWVTDDAPPARRPTLLPLRARRRRRCEPLRVRFTPY